MSKKTTKVLASATLMSLVLTTALSAGPVKAAAGQVTRTGGSDRYETAAKVATANWTSDNTESVILVNGLSYADSVSASALAKKLNAPILLTGANSLDANAKSALDTLKPKNVYIVGGTAAVSKSVESSLSGYTVTRLAGENRYATNIAVANKLVDLGVSKDNLLVVTGQAYSDALSAAPVAAAKGEILLLSTNDKTVMQPTYDFAKDSNVTVVGTTYSVDDSTYSKLAADKRVDGGKDRFETNINILKAFDSDLKNDYLYASTAKANGDGVKDTAFADALVASAVAGKNSAPLVLLGADDSDANKAALDYIGTKATSSTDLQVIGGTGAVSQDVENKINGLFENKFDGTVTSVETVADQYVNAKADDETLQFTVNGGTKVTAQDIVDAGYGIKFTADEDVFETSTNEGGVYVSKDGILDKDKLQDNILDVEKDTFKYSVEVTKNGEVIGQTGDEKVNVINGDQTANSLSDITVKQIGEVDEENPVTDINTTPSSVTTKVTSNKLVKNDWVQVTKVTGNIGDASGVTVTNKKFYSSDPFVAEVGENTGVIHALNPGTFTLTVKSGSASKDYTFTVSSDTSRKVKTAEPSLSTIKVGKGASIDFTVVLKDQFGDPIKAEKIDSAIEDYQFQVSDNIKDGDTTVATTTASAVNEDGKTTINITGNATGSGNLKIYNKDGVIKTIPIQVVADSAVDNIKVEAASDESDSKDLTLDLDPKSADDNGDGYVKLNVNKYSSNGTYLGKATSGVTITATNDSDKKFIEEGKSTNPITPNGTTGYFTIALPYATEDDYGSDTSVLRLIDNSNDVDTGTITITAKYGDKTASAKLNVKDSTPSISSAKFNSDLSTTFGAIELKDVIDASNIKVGSSQGDGKVRIAEDGTIFIKADASKNNDTSIEDINDSDIKYNAKYDITLGKVKVAVKSGDVQSVSAIENGEFTVTAKSGVSNPSGYVRVAIQKVHADTPFTYSDVKVSDNN